MRRRQRNERHYDVTAKRVFKGLIPIWVFAVIAMLLVGFICCLSAAFDQDITVDIEGINEANHLAEVFNALPLETRTELEPIIEKSLSEDKTIPLQEPPKAPEKKDYSQLWIFHLIGFFIAGYLISVSYVFFKYVARRNDDYYLVDFPKRAVGVWIAIVTVPLFFPVYLVSWVRFQIFLRKLRIEESEAVEETARQEIKSKDRKTPAAKKVYIDYVTRGRVEGYKLEKARIERAIETTTSRLRDLSGRMQEEQRNLASYNQQLRANEAESPAESRARAGEEWDQICQMRGVSKIRVDYQNGRPILVISVRVRVQYRKDFFDFGDYDIRIDRKYYSAIQTRSGIRRNATSSEPDYNESGGFCFGERKGEITKYLEGGRILEAIILMIDSLHSVNSKEAEEDIPRCFRKVSRIEAVKEKLAKGDD